MDLDEAPDKVDLYSGENLFREINDLRSDMYEQQFRQRQQRESDMKLLVVAVYAFCLGLILGRVNSTEN